VDAQVVAEGYPPVTPEEKKDGDNTDNFSGNQTTY